jgi:hypothetical protein
MSASKVASKQAMRHLQCVSLSTLIPLYLCPHTLSLSLFFEVLLRLFEGRQCGTCSPSLSHMQCLPLTCSLSLSHLQCLSLTCSPSLSHLQCLNLTCNPSLSHLQCLSFSTQHTASPSSSPTPPPRPPPPTLLALCFSLPPPFLVLGGAVTL